ncbi:MAG: ABC-type transporter Mla subunit MlaD [Pseudohongiellaceae bacterium]|jgi:ABC-type transporter Mla subunit MlaD
MESMINLSAVTWALVGLIVLLGVYFHGPSYSIQTVKNAPSILTSFGIFGTFLGIAFGLMGFNSADIEASVPLMIDGLGVAVWSSISGILAALSIRLRYAISSVRSAKQAGSKLATVNDLNTSILVLNDNVAMLRQENLEQSTSLLAANENYQQQMVAANTDALTTALSGIMQDFNSKIEVQYGENFKEFNESLGKLLAWQQSYSQQLNAMLEMHDSSLKVIDKAGQSYQEMIVHSQEFSKIAGSLGELLAGLESQTRNLEGYLSGLSGLVGQASEGLPALGDYVSELTVKLSESIEQNNKSLTQVLTQASKDITSTVDEVNRGLAASVESAHSGLAEHVAGMSSKTQKQMEILDKSMEKQLNLALQTFGYQLTALSEKFVNDYIPLTDRLRDLVTLAEQTKVHKEKVR